MTATVMSSFFDYEVTNKNNKMMSYNSPLSSPHLQSVPTTGANTPFTPTGSLLDRKVVGTFSGTLPASPLRVRYQFQINAEPIHQQSQDGRLGFPERKQQQQGESLRDRSYSENGERLRPSNITCLSANGNSQVNSSRYKTELCRPFEENGTCKYGDKCQFAHGMHELRSLNRHPKYKTELCRTFHSIGYCPYGPRCHFIHNAEERRGPPPLSTFNKMERPRLHHSYSFAGFTSSGGSQDSPTSVTPPPIFSTEDINEWPSNPFTFSSQELANLFGPSLGGTTVPDLPGPHSPTAPSFFRPMSESPPSPPDSLSDQEGYQSSLGSQSGSESPVLDATRRLPIFSRLSISDD